MKKTTDNKSVRFNLEQFDYVCTKERLSTPQSVVNFLLQDYWIRNKIVPKVLEAQNQVAALTECINEYPPKEAYNIKMFGSGEKAKKTFQDFMNEIPNLQYEAEHRKLWNEIQDSDLTAKQKELLKINMTKSNL